MASLLRLPVNTHDLHRQVGGRRELVRTLYEELAKKEIRYNVEPQGALPNRQTIRTPHDIFEAPGYGTCLDLALLFCGLCLGHDLIPILVVLDGHALVMVSLGHGLQGLEEYGRTERLLFSEGQLAGGTGVEQLRRLVEQAEYLAIECTGFAHTETLTGSFPEEIGRVGGYLPFERAIEAGLENFSATRRQFRYALEVALLHQLGVTPFEILPCAIELGREKTADTSQVVTSAGCEPARPRGIEFETITFLEARLRSKVDEDGKAISDEVGKSFGAHDFGRVISSSTRLLDWLSGEGQSASRPVRGSLFALLSDIATLEAGLGMEVPRTDFSTAKDFYRQALESYGAESSDEDEARLTTLRAKIEYLSGDRDAALSLVDGRTEPPCMSLRLSILIDQERHAEATRTVEGIPPHEKWCEKAITVRVMTGDRKGADELLAWAQDREDLACYRRSLLAYPQALFISALGGAEAASKARPHAITDGQKQTLVEALDLLQPLLRPAEDLGRPGSGLEVEAHTAAMQIALLTGDVSQRSRSASILAAATPVPLEFANAAIRGDIPTPDDLPARLRRDHPRSLQAQILAAMIEARRLGRADDACSALTMATGLATTGEQKLELSQCLFELSTAASVDRTEESLPLVRGLLGEDHRFTQLVQAFRLIEAGDTGGAGRILSKHEASDDPLWLQLSAKKKLNEGDRAGAMEDFITAGLYLGSVDLLRSGAGIANSLGRHGRETFALERILEIDPGDRNARKALAANLLGGQEYRQAAAELARLRELGVDEKEIVFNHGVALCNSGRAREGLAAYRELTMRHPDWLPGVGACVQLLHVLGQSDEAFRLLHGARDRFWSVPAFLMQYVDMAHAAAWEEEANEGLRRLLELERPDQGTSSTLRVFTIEQFKEMARERFENQKDIDRKILEGRFPWLLAGGVLGRILSRDWSYRTQPLNVGDHPLARAEFGIYATNGLRVEGDEEAGRKLLVRTACPPPGTAVVADLSALVTLDRIGALDEALAYFGKVLIPASYQPKLLYEQGLLRAIQPARLAGLRAIRDAADRGRLLIHRLGEAIAGGMTTLHEYREPGEPGAFGVVDVATEFLRTGHIGIDQFDALRRAARHIPSASAGDVRATIESGALISDEFTLALLREHGALDPLLDSARVYIEEDEIGRIRNDLHLAKFDGEILGWHEALRERLASDPRFETVPVPAREQQTGAKDEETDAVEDGKADDVDAAATLNRRFLPLHASEIAHARSLPLLVDDRVFQSVLFNGSPGSAHAAFGTGDVLPALVEAGRLDLDRAARLFLHLIRLRYRFLLPPAEFLAALARRHRSHPPGEPLREVARYVHDCMRDPGLHGGMEPTDPPISMAVYLCQQWAITVGEFLVAVWHDDGFDDDAAVALTRWTVRECLPSIPRNCPPALAAVLGQKLPMVVISGALVHMPRIANSTRTNRALEEIARAFSLSNGAYTQIVADILLPFVDSTHDETTIPGQVLRAFAVTALRHLSEVEPGTHYALCRLGLIEPKTREEELSAVQIAEIADQLRQVEIGFPEGPLALITEPDRSDSRVMIPVPVLVLDEDPSVRAAALSFLRSLADARPCALSAFSRAILGEYSDAIVSTDRDRWFPAACRLIQVLDEDYLLNLAGFRQKLWTGSHDPERQYRPKLVRPGRALAASVQASEYDPAATPEEASSEIERIARESVTLREALDAYLEQFGHLPLAPPLSSGSVVRRWLDQRGDTPDVWDEIWTWAGPRFDPVRRYHACRAFLEKPSLVPDGMKGRFWEELASSLRSSRIAATDEPCGRSWVLRTNVARLYLLQLESHVPGHDPDQLARLAWWAGCRLVGSIENSGHGRASTDEFLEWIHKKLIDPAYSRERVLSLLGAGGSGLSPLSFATTYGGCPWALSLLSTIGEGTSALDPGAATEDARGVITDSLILHLALGFPLASEAENPWPFAFGETLRHAAVFWHGVEPDEGKKDAIVRLLEQHVRLADPDALLETLRTLHSCEEDDRRVFLNAFAGIAHCGDLPSDKVIGMVSDPLWFRRAMTELPDHEVGRLLDVLITAERRFGGDWQTTLPHLIAGAVELEGLPLGRREYLVQNVIRACAASGTASALRSLSLGTRPLRHAAVLRNFRETLESYVPAGSPWVTSHLRDILSSLPAASAEPAKLPGPPRG